MKAVNNLVDNLLKVIDFTENFCNSGADDSVFPHVLSKSNLDKHKGRNNQPTTKDSFSSPTKKRRVNKKKKHIPSKGKKPTKVFPSQFIVSSPSDLIGKIIYHFTDKDDEGECTWVKAIALNICGGNSANPKFKIQPSGNGGEDYVTNLYQDFKNGEVQLCDVTINDFIDATIDHLFNDSESGENT